MYLLGEIVADEVLKYEQCDTTPAYVMHDLQYHCYSYSSGLLKAG